MNQKERTRTVVLALGNPIRSDDGVALAALRRLEEDPGVSGSADLVEGGTKGLELVSYVSGAKRLLVLDAVDVSAQAGTVVCLQGEELRSLPGNGNVHDLALADILNALRMLGEEPQETVLLGVQPSTTVLGTSLSECVELAVPVLVEAAIAQLSRWECRESCGRGAEHESFQNMVAVSCKERRPDSTRQVISGAFDVPGNSR